MGKSFGTLPDGRQTRLYTICGGGLRADFTDYGATLVALHVPDRNGQYADVVLGYDDVMGYVNDDFCIGATVGRNSNRIKGGRFTLNGQTYTLAQNDNDNNLHSGPDFYSQRLWQVDDYQADRIIFRLESPHGDQGFPGNATIRVLFKLEAPGTLHIAYEAVCDQDTIFNMTNHSYFNLAGHENTDKAVHQILTIPASRFLVSDNTCTPTGEVRDVSGSPFDFREPKAISRDIHADYETLRLQAGYDHCYLNETPMCAQLQDPGSGRCMRVYTDMPGVQLFTGNDLSLTGKGNVSYPVYSGICLETQYYPDAINHPQWPQPILRAGKTFQSVTSFVFTAE